MNSFTEHQCYVKRQITKRSDSDKWSLMKGKEYK